MLLLLPMLLAAMGSTGTGTVTIATERVEVEDDVAIGGFKIVMNWVYSA